MWNNFCAVVLDLFWFAIGVQSKNEIVVYGGENNGLRIPQLALPATLPSVLLPIPLSPTLLAPIRPIDTKTAMSTQSVADSIQNQSPAILHAPVVMYVCAALGTTCVHTPHLDFDAGIETLAFGTAVTVIGYQGRYASVNRSNITGWVLKDDITPQKHEVWPVFISGTVYSATHLDTIKTRLLLGDMFGAGELALPLQAGEYIAVRLKSEHRVISWSRKRPRLVGTWATLLRGTSGIHIGVNPKTDSIMEWHNSEGEGSVGYVESVTPENTITVGAVGTDEAGYYSVKTMSEEIWRELRPVFIEVA